jgi:hypothetical protein
VADTILLVWTQSTRQQVLESRVPKLAPCVHCKLKLARPALAAGCQQAEQSSDEKVWAVADTAALVALLGSIVTNPSELLNVCG